MRQSRWRNRIGGFAGWLIVLVVPALAANGCAAPQAGAAETSPPSLVETGPGPLPPAIAPVKPNPWAGLSVAELARRDYGAGELRTDDTLGVNEAFTRTLVSWESDGVRVYAFQNTPAGEGPFPLVIMIHGYVDPEVYSTLTYTTRYADALARAGFLVIHPNLRGYPPSEDGPNPLRIGFAIDILNLIADIEEQAGRPGPLQVADGERIGLWGHSMGGGIAQRVLATSDAVDAAVLYGSMSGDEQRNHDQILNVFSGGTRGNWEEDEAPSAEQLRLISPANHLERVTAPVSIHHGAFDEQVPLEWSSELCAALQAAGKAVECYVYDGQPHTFVGEGDALFQARVADFFGRYLRAPDKN